MNFYQIQTKFRDEIRPRFGVMRAREFIMKDAYSFHTDQTTCSASTASMHDAYARIFTRLGLKFRAVAADTGAIGGTGSHEFHVLADSGEDAIAFARRSRLRRQRRAGRGACAPASRAPAPREAMKKVATPGKTTCEDVARAARSCRSSARSSRSLVDARDEAAWSLLLVRGDHELNEIKAQQARRVWRRFRFATEARDRAGARLRRPAPSGRSGHEDAGHRRPHASRRWATSSAARTRTASTSPA